MALCAPVPVKGAIGPLGRSLAPDRGTVEQGPGMTKHEPQADPE